MDRNLYKAFVLHARAYRETSLLLDVLTLDAGRMSMVAKGAKRGKSSLQSILQPFTLLEINWFGRGELVTLKTAEPCGSVIFLSGEKLLSGLYANELLTRVLHQHDPCEGIFLAYQTLLSHLSKGGNTEIALRYFEKKLLEELGYGLSLSHVIKTNESIEADQDYFYTTEGGFVKFTSDLTETYQSRRFEGRHLLAIAEDNYEDESVRQSAKRLMRLAISSLLEGKPLKSREMFY